MSIRDLTENLAKAAGFEVPEEVHREADAYERDLAAIQNDPDLSADAKRRKAAERQQRTVAALQRLAETSAKASAGSLDQAEGAIRASLRFDVPGLSSTYASDSNKLLQAVARRAADAERRAICQDLVASIRTAEDAEEIEEAADDVAAYGHPGMTARARREARLRLHALARRAAPHLKAEYQHAAMRAANAEAEHRKAHPGPSRALKNIERERAVRQQIVGNFYTNLLPRALKLPSSDEQQRREILAAASVGQ
jgi:hypothetical protein